MSRTSSDEQLYFLLRCVKHSNNGKVDFQAVADECSIVSKGAAAKRYERMMKANGINPNGGGAATPEAESPSKAANTPKKTPAKTPTKRKAKGAGADSDAPKKRRGRKAAATPKKGKSDEKATDADSDDANETTIKKEDGLRGDNDPFLTQPGDNADRDDAMFKQFVDTAASSPDTEKEMGEVVEENVFIKQEYA